MIKFVLILTSVVSLNFAVSFSDLEEKTNNPIELLFSNKAIGIESGQPVYPINTKIWITNKSKNIKELKVYINEGDVVTAVGKKIDLSDITKLETGTYTLVVDANGENTFGFTIQ